MKVLKYGLWILAGVFLSLAIFFMLEPAGQGELGGIIQFGTVVIALAASVFCAVLVLLITFWHKKIFRYILLLLILGPILYFAATRAMFYIELNTYERTQAVQADRSTIIADLYLDRLTSLGSDIDAFEQLQGDFYQHLLSENISPLTQGNTEYFGWTRNMYIVTFVDPDYRLEILYFTKPEYCAAFTDRFSDQLHTAITTDFLRTDCGRY